MPRWLAVAGLLSVSVVLIPISSAGGSLANTWAGTWKIAPNTCCGSGSVSMTLNASGSGSYTFCGGSISGATIRDNRLTGTWTQAQGSGSCAVKETSGPVEFVMASDGNSFSGHWRYASSSAWDGPWNGTCSGGACLNNGGGRTASSEYRWRVSVDGRPSKGALPKGAKSSLVVGTGHATFLVQGSTRAPESASGYVRVSDRFPTRGPARIVLTVQEVRAIHVTKTLTQLDLGVKVTSSTFRDCPSKSRGTVTLLDGGGGVNDAFRFQLCGATRIYTAGVASHAEVTITKA